MIIFDVLFGLFLAGCGAEIVKCGFRDGFLDDGCFEVAFGGLFLFVGILVLVGTLVT